MSNKDIMDRVVTIYACKGSAYVVLDERVLKKTQRKDLAGVTKALRDLAARFDSLSDKKEKDDNWDPA